MPTEGAPPPVYTQEAPASAAADDRSASASEAAAAAAAEPLQVLIVPTTDTVSFQKGFLGADGERAAIEGELQIKGADASEWEEVTMQLRTVESAPGGEIELYAATVVLFSAAEHPPPARLPASLPFSIPLTPDTPQCVHTPHSAVAHVLTARLRPAAAAAAPDVAQRLAVHTRRFLSHLHAAGGAPAAYALAAPTPVRAEVPRGAFAAGERIPVYVTIPPPRTALVVDEGLRLRNVRAELVRTVRVGGPAGAGGGAPVEEEDDDDDEPAADEEELLAGDGAGPSHLPEKHPRAATAHGPGSPAPRGTTYRSVISRTGASCRFHSTRAIKLRFVLHPAPPPSSSPSAFETSLPAPADHDSFADDTQCASISQATLLHSVVFRINVYVSFVDMSTRTEQCHVLRIPVTITPPPAPLPEVEDSLDQAYQKKHDRPPARTVRLEEAEMSAPRYEEGQAGPSLFHAGAPPPFDEPDAPPPPFFSALGPSTSSRLPTFLESESEIFMPTSEDRSTAPFPQAPLAIPGEGTLFGFAYQEQFDGHVEDLRPSLTPPPSLEMAARDADVTGLAHIDAPARAIEALGRALEQRAELAHGGALPPPPPPPAMDDPSDPPPSIDSVFRSPLGAPRQQASPAQSPALPPPSPFAQPADPATPAPAPAGPAGQPPHGHAPPPYLVPESQSEREQVTRPPPYMDVLPPAADGR